MDVYVAAPWCAAAKEELARHGATAGHYEVAVRCLAPSERVGSGSVVAEGRTGRRIDLAAIGANSRRATEDTSSGATLEPPGPATRFTRSILESANVPLVTSSSPAQGMKRILESIEGAGSSNVRASVQHSLEPG